MSDRNFLAVLSLLVFLSVVFVVFVMLAFNSDEQQDTSIIFITRDLEVRAVCTVESGVIITTNYNSRIAGDAVSSVRMTDPEYQTYCIDANKEYPQEAK